MVRLSVSEVILWHVENISLAKHNGTEEKVYRKKG